MPVLSSSDDPSAPDVGSEREGGSRAATRPGSILVFAAALAVAGMLPASPLATALVAQEREAAAEIDVEALRARCEVVHPIPDQSILYGYIVEDESGTALPGGTVHLSWIERRGVADSTIHRARADSPDGAYVFCDVPQDVRIRAWADAVGRSGGGTSVFFTGGETERRDIRIGIDRHTGAIYGQLRDADSGRPIEGATITIEAIGVSALSDRNGRFIVDDIAAGTHDVRISHVAYGTPGLSIVVGTGESTHTEIALEPRAIALEPISVEVKMRPQWLENRGFYERMERGFGQFVTPEEIETTRWRRFSEILRDVQGVNLEGDPCSPRCDPSVRFGITTTSQESCSPEIYLDGNRLVAPAASNGWDLDVFAHPSDLAAIEIYRGISETPVEFYGRCGSIVVWTRRGAG